LRIFHFLIFHIVIVPEMGAGVAWDLREMGSAWGRGVRNCPAPQESREDKLSKEGGNMEKEEEGKASQA
jgi:hypothetical protein